METKALAIDEKFLDENIRLYDDYPMPVAICDTALEYVWANAVWKSQYPNLAGGARIKDLLMPISATDLIFQLECRPYVQISNALSLSGAKINLTSLLQDKQLVGVVVTIIEAAVSAPHRSTARASRAPDYIEEAIRRSADKILTAAGNLDHNAKQFDRNWVTPSLNSIAQAEYHLLRSVSNITKMMTFQARTLEELVHESATTCDVFDVIDTAKTEITGIAEKMGIPVRIIMSNEHGFCDISKANFELAFYNILHNSLYFTRLSNTVEICAEATDKYVAITIKDNGIGIAADDIDSIFKPYYSKGYDNQSAGVGLGLTIAEAVIRERGGKIEIESKQGIGTTARIIIPKTIAPSVVPFAQSGGANKIADRFSPLNIGLTSALQSPYREND